MNDQLNPADEELDSRLRDWSRHQSVDSQTLDRLQRRIVGAVAISRGVVRRPQPSRAVVAVCAIAAGLLAAVFVQSTIPGKFDSRIRINSEGRHRFADLWNKTSEVFGSDLEWIGDLDGELLLGVNHQTTPPGSTTRICLSLTLREFDTSTKTWVNSWTGRITCPTGSAIDFASADHRATGAIWVQSQPDGRFAVSHWLNWQEHPEASGPIDGSAAEGESQVVTDCIRNGHHVQVIQQIWRPDAG